MASLEDHYKANGSRLSRLLIDKGTEAMRNVFDSIHPPATLTATLNSNRHFLKKLRFINSSQIDILFPPSGVPPKSTDFDISLLFVLLRNICGLHHSASVGSWDTKPPPSDTSREANLARIKYYRNEVYGHITTTGVDDANFHSYWNDISAAVIGLGVSEGDVKLLKSCPLEETLYLDLIKEWKEKEDGFEVMLLEGKKWQSDTDTKLRAISESQEEYQKAMVQNQKSLSQKLDILPKALEVVQKTAHVVKDVSKRLVKETVLTPDALQRLVNCDFQPNIERLNNSFHPGTRGWLLEKLDRWLTDEVSDYRVMMLIAGPGVGKSVFAAKACQVYKEQLAACHFCVFNYSDYTDPFAIFESLANHMCKNVSGFYERLIQQLYRRHTKHTIRDAFRVLLKDPLNSLPNRRPMLMVIDGLDESERDGKCELLDLIAEEFPQLPKWMKIFITSRPELPVKKQLHHFYSVEILPDDKENEKDLKCFLESSINHERPADKYQMNQLVNKCEGSFLYAHHCQVELRRLDKDADFISIAPKGIGSTYERYFLRLEEELKKLSSNINFDRILEVLMAMKAPIPLSFVAEILQLAGDTRAMKEVIRKVNDSLSALLLVYNDCLTVFHKTVVDWLVSEEYEQHSFRVSKESLSGHKHLWQVCQRKFMKLERSKESEKKTEAENYAVKYGVHHLREITIGPDHFSGRMLPGVGAAMLLDRNLKRCGYGWLVSKDKKGVYVMTTSDVLHRIKHDEDDPHEKLHFFIESCNDKKPAPCSVIKTEKKFVIVSSKKGGILDYVVLRFKTSSKVTLEKPLNVSKQYPEPLETVGVPYSGLGCPNKSFCQRCIVLQYPEDLIDWLKVGSRSSFHSVAKRTPSPGCDPTIDWKKAKDLREVLIPYWKTDHHANECFSGLPLFTFQDSKVVGMCSRRVFITEENEENHCINFGIRFDKIIEDINSKNSLVARNLFPEHFY